MGLGLTTRLVLICALAVPAHAQILQGILNPVGSGAAPIALDASCHGNGTANFIQCSSAMTVTAGDTIACNVTGNNGGSFLTGTAVDPSNGYYSNVFGIVHPVGTLSWVAPAVKFNSAGGSITPELFYSGAPSSEGTINCIAFKNTATADVLDGGSVTQISSATVTNPTSGTAAAPSNNNEAVMACMSRSSSTVPSAGSGFTLSGTLVGSTNLRQACEYQIQTTATAVNGAFTGNGSSIAMVDSQFALLQSGQTGGYPAITGTFVPLGSPGSAPTGTTSTTLIGSATSWLSTINYSGETLTLSGTAPTYDTTTANVPTGGLKLMVNGVTHTPGDAGSSMEVAGATGTGNYSWADDIGGLGTPHWLSMFYQVASGGTTNEQCDDASMSGATTEPQMIWQANYVSTSVFTVKMEGSSPVYGSAASANLSPNTNYWIQMHLAGVNERYHQLLFSTKSGSTWSLQSTLNMDVLCSNAATGSCANAPTAATPTGTASSGSTALTVSSGTGIVVGQVVTGTGIGDPSQSCTGGNCAWTVVEGVSGTSVTLSQNTIGAVSGTVNFYTPPAHFVAGTDLSSSAAAGATSITVAAPGTGTPATGNAVGGPGIVQGTTATNVTGAGPYTVTLSIPTSGAISSGVGVTFWSPPSSSSFEFGKNAGGSCGINSNQWWSGMFYDPYGIYGQFEPNAGAF